MALEKALPAPLWQHYPGRDRKYNTADLNHDSGFTALAFIVTAQRFEELKG